MPNWKNIVFQYEKLYFIYCNYSAEYVVGTLYLTDFFQKGLKVCKQCVKFEFLTLSEHLQKVCKTQIWHSWNTIR